MRSDSDSWFQKSGAGTRQVARRIITLTAFERSSAIREWAAGNMRILVLVVLLAAMAGYARDPALAGTVEPNTCVITDVRGVQVTAQDLYAVYADNSSLWIGRRPADRHESAFIFRVRRDEFPSPWEITRIPFSQVRRFVILTYPE